MTDELELETTPEEELDTLADLSELEELSELDGAEEEALAEAEDEEEAPEECCGKCRRINKRKLALIGGIALGLAIAALIAAIFANRASKKD